MWKLTLIRNVANLHHTYIKASELLETTNVFIVFSLLFWLFNHQFGANCCFTQSVFMSSGKLDLFIKCL